MPIFVNGNTLTSARAALNDQIIHPVKYYRKVTHHLLDGLSDWVIKCVDRLGESIGVAHPGPPELPQVSHVKPAFLYFSWSKGHFSDALWELELAAGLTLEFEILSDIVFLLDKL